MEATIFRQNLIDFMQTIFMVVGFFITAKTFINQNLSRKAEFRMKIDDKYQTIKRTAIDNAELARVFKHLKNKKITVSSAEEAYTKQLINNIHMLYDIWKLKQIDITEGMEKDIANLFTYTIPSMVWNKIKPYQDEEFVNYIDLILQKKFSR